MKKKITITVIVVIAVVLLLMNVSFLPRAKLTIRVFDEQGKPVEGAMVSMGLMAPKGRGKGWGATSSRVKGLSDKAGIFTATGPSQPFVSYSAYKEGYYGTGGSFNKFTGVSGIIGFRRYQPWNKTVELVLKRKINPIPMYAMEMHAGSMRPVEIPVINKFVGFDLEANDWVAPYGKGVHGDFLFKLKIDRAIDYRDFDVSLILQFSNKGDGIQEYPLDISKGLSELIMPHHAPIDGYRPQWVDRKFKKPGITRIGKRGKLGNPDYDHNYFFRVRTKLDENGKVIGGRYGKIHWKIRFYKFASPAPIKPSVAFNYYLNPNDNDTNVEFDLKKNLFKHIPRKRRVQRP